MLIHFNMRKLIAVFLYAIFYPTIIKESRRTDSVLAIYGHDSKREPFEKLIKWFLKRDYHFITQYEFYDYLNGKKLVNNKNIYLSFDDGWRSNFTDVLPVLQKYNIPATIFLSTKGMRDGYYWFSNAFQNRQSSLYSKVDELWEMPNAMRMSIISKLPPFKGERETMNEREVLLMTESGLVSWGNHTDDHVISNNCSDIELKEEESNCDISSLSFEYNISSEYNMWLYNDTCLNA